MSTPAAAPPPLPPGWTEHKGPDGTPYYYHRVSGTSTYTRPVIPGVSAAAPVKEKPKNKRPVPGTEWLRVETTAGHVFYSHVVNKTSSWTVPDEIKDVVSRLDAEGWDRAEERAEVERVKAELKRKAEDDERETEPKKARVVDNDDDHEKLLPRPKKLKPDEAAAQALGASSDKVVLTPEEAKALFMTLLQEKEINPLLPWDTSLPQFIHDPRYALLPSQTTRKEVFDEYCREAVRKQKEAKALAGIKKATPEEAFDALLERTCTSTRTTYTEWRRHAKKERAFLDYGRSERERETRFRAFLKTLGERKRRDKERAEKDFFDLLRQTGAARTEDGVFKEWKDAKKTHGLAEDPRYDAVGSATLREELYGSFVRLLQREHAEGPDDATKRKARQERAERERAAQVRAQQEKVQAETTRAKKMLGGEEAEAEFRSLLTDAIRDVTTWDEAVDQLRTDARFDTAGEIIGPTQQRALFRTHVDRIVARHLAALHALFGAHCPKLDDPYPGESVERSAPAERLRWSPGRVRDEFDIWARKRKDDAKRDFDAMLRENSFVEFWGRARKLTGEAKKTEEDEEEGEEGGGTADLTSLARGIGLDEVEKVLGGDKRYIVWEHIPEQREGWIREYLQQLAAPKLSVHVPEH